MDNLALGGLVALAGAVGAGLAKGIDFFLSKRKGLRKDSIEELSEHLGKVTLAHDQERMRMQGEIDKLKKDQIEDQEKCDKRIDALQQEVVDQKIRLGNMRFHINWVDQQMKKFDPNHVPFVDMSGTHTPLQT